VTTYLRESFTSWKIGGASTAWTSKVTKLGIDFLVKQIYNPIEDKAWLPVSQQFRIDGKVFGFPLEYSYLATVKDYKITLNPKLPVGIEGGR